MAPTLPLLVRPLYEVFQDVDGTGSLQDSVEDESGCRSQATLEEAIKAALDEFAQHAALQVSKEMSDIRFEQRVHLKAFRQRLWRRWGRGLKLLSVVGQLAAETGAEVTFVAQSTGKAGPMLTALASIHARGCQVFQEIIVLLRHGFAEGADARWRTLHELSVTALFIAQKGETVAQR